MYEIEIIVDNIGLWKDYHGATQKLKINENEEEEKEDRGIRLFNSFTTVSRI